MIKEVKFNFNFIHWIFHLSFNLYVFLINVKLLLNNYLYIDYPNNISHIDFNLEFYKNFTLYYKHSILDKQGKIFISWSINNVRHNLDERINEKYHQTCIFIYTYEDYWLWPLIWNTLSHNSINGIELKTIESTEL